MKILRLSCENINSLKGKATKLDLSSGILADTGLFVICGPTGAGKSTLLDVICVALYGKTPRLETQTDHLMSKTTGHCWAEVEFEVAQTKYRSRWELRRARQKVDGAMQGSKMTLSRLDHEGVGKIIEEKTSKVPLAIQELTGLDFRRFCRSMLLAQGEFDAFLKGKDNERAELLEKMTGTEVYRDISIEVFERSKAAKQMWENQETWQAQHLKNKSSRSLEDLNLEVQKSQSTMQRKKDELDQVAKEIEQGLKFKEYQGRLEVFQRQQDEWNKNEQSDERLKWRCWLRAEPLEQAYRQFKTQNEEFGQKNRELERSEKEWYVLKKQCQIIQDERLAESEKSKKLQCEKETLGQLYPKFVELKEKESQCNQRLKELHGQLDDLTKQQQSKIGLIEKNKQECEQIQIKITAIKEFFERVGPPALQKKILEEMQSEWDGVKENKARIEEISFDLKQLSQELESLELERKTKQETCLVLTEQQKELQGVEKELRVKEQCLSLGMPEYWKTQHLGQYQKIHSLKIQNDRETEKLKKIKNEISHLENSLAHQQSELSKRVSQLEAMKRQETKQHWAVHRHELKSGEPCPLCGSEEHPYRLQEDELTEFNAELSNLKEQEEALKVQLIQEQERLRLFENQEKEISDQIQGYEELLQRECEKIGWDDLNIDKLNELEEAFGRQIQLSEFKNQYVELQSKLIQVQNDLSSKERGRQACDQKCIDLQTSIKEKSSLQAQLQVESEKCEKSIFDKALLLELPLKLSSSLSEDLRKALGELEKRAEDHLKDQQKLETLERELIQLSASERELDRQIKRARQQYEEYADIKSSILAERQGLHPEADRFFDLHQQVQEKYDQQKLVLEQKERAKLEGELKLEQLQKQTKALEQELPSYLEGLKRLKCDFESKLKKQEFESVERYEEVMDKKESYLNLKAWNDQHELDKKELEILKTQLENQKVMAPQNGLDHNSARQKQLQQEIELLQQSLGALQREKQQEELWQQQFKEQQEKLKQTEKDYLEWDQLKRLIGSADGSAFRKIAQRITLKFLLRLANRHLKTILERYQLVEEPGREMGIILKDCYQAMSVRPMETLSGGERFMISLALALALSDISRKHQSIESLFIDEGFGALDVHALDRVLESLDKIRQMGRSIGIISHIDALKERIPAQIQVLPAQGGSSTVKVVGVN